MIVRLALHAMATRFELVLDGPDAVALRAAGEEALEIIAEFDQRLSLFNKQSMLSFINTTAANRPVVLDDDLLELLTLCHQVHAQSHGAFDVTVGPLMRSLGFHDRPGPDGPIGSEHVLLDPANRTIRFDRQGIEIDLGAIAKGAALDAAASILKECGIERALIHGGTSTAIAIGSPPDLPGWRIKIADGPTVMLRDAAVSVSAPHGRMIQTEQGTVGHVLDPRLGQSAVGATAAVVIGPTAALADAWSTALLVLKAPPDSIPDSLTTCINLGEKGAPDWSVHGADPSRFTFDTSRNLEISPQCQLQTVERS